jgi:hypothetical protein
VVVLGGAFSELLDVATTIAGWGRRQPVLVGGLAVACHCPDIERVTVDVDDVFDRPDDASEPTATLLVVDEIASAPDRPGRGDRVEVGGVLVDIIDTAPLTADDLDGIDEHHRLFLVAHRYALETARPIVLDTAPSRGTPVEILVAEPAALVATKLVAFAGRQGTDTPRKRASDLVDLHRLLVTHDRRGGVAEVLRAAPFGLASLVADAAERLLVRDVARSAQALNFGDPSWGIAPSDLLLVGELLVERLRR